MTRAVLFDLDETLTDRSASILRYAARLRGDFTSALIEESVERIADTIRAADVRGYAPRAELFAAVQNRLAWREREIFLHAAALVGCACEATWFVGDHPGNDIDGARRAGMRAVWLRGVHAWPDALPHPQHAIDVIPDLLALVDS